MSDLSDLSFKVESFEHQIQQLKAEQQQSITRLQEQLALARHTPAASSTGNVLAQCAGAVLGQRVEWTIPTIRQRIKDQPPGQSIYSPGFDVAGISGIQLEFYPTGRISSNPAGGGEGSASQAVGKQFCSLFLWCPPGTHIRYILYCGNYKRAPDEDKFEARMGHGHSNFCILEEQIDDDTDSVTVGIELVEVINRAAELGPDIKLVWPALRELVQKEMEVKLNENIEKVEWTITNISQRAKKWEKGTSLFSPLFTAAGVRDILFEFYPNGSAVTSQEGFCGFYIRCPDGTSVTLTLFVGKVKKGPISARFEHAAGKGLPDFCELAAEIDHASDSVTVGIEIRNNDFPMPRTLRI